MSKSILVIDKPKSCQDCRLSIEGGNMCVPLKKFVSRNKIHPRCPLQDTTELLEALEVLKKDLEWYFSLNERQESAYNKLKQALGGKE